MQESHLAEAVAGAELGAPFASNRHLRPTVGDHEGLSSKVALAHQHPAGGDLDFLGQGGDPGEISLGACREKLDLREPLDLRVASSSRSFHRLEYFSAVGTVRLIFSWKRYRYGSSAVHGPYVAE